MFSVDRRRHRVSRVLSFTSTVVQIPIAISAVMAICFIVILTGLFTRTGSRIRQMALEEVTIRNQK